MKTQLTKPTMIVLLLSFLIMASISIYLAYTAPNVLFQCLYTANALSFFAAFLASYIELSSKHYDKEVLLSRLVFGLILFIACLPAVFTALALQWHFSYKTLSYYIMKVALFSYPFMYVGSISLSYLYLKFGVRHRGLMIVSLLPLLNLLVLGIMLSCS